VASAAAATASPTSARRFERLDRALAPAPRAHVRRQRRHAEEVVQGAEEVQPPPHRAVPEHVAREERHGSRDHAEQVLRPHDQVAHRRRGHAVDHPRERPQAAPHGAVELAVQARRGARIGEDPVDDVGTEERAVHREVHAARKHRVDEAVCVANHDVAVAGHAIGVVGVVAGRGRRPGQPGVAQAVGEPGRERDRLEEERRRVGLARLHVVRPAHRADARRAVLQRNEPEPAVLEPEHADVAFLAPGEPARAGEMPEQRGAVVARVAALDAELVGEERVAARGVDEELRAPAARRAVLASGGDAHGVGREIDLGDAGFLVDLGAVRRAVPEQQVVELRPAHLVGVRPGRIERAAEVVRE
jgi:hypothetical protein